jgi:hypothetical protein
MVKTSSKNNKRKGAKASAAAKPSAAALAPAKKRARMRRPTTAPPKPHPPPEWSKEDIAALMENSDKAPYLEALTSRNFINTANTPQLTQTLTRAELLGQVHPQNLKSLRDYAIVAAGTLASRGDAPDSEPDGQTSETSDSDSESSNDTEQTSTSKTHERKKKRRKRSKHTPTTIDDSEDEHEPDQATRQVKVTINGRVLDARDDTVTVISKTKISGIDMCTITAESLDSPITCKAIDLYTSPFQYAYNAWEEKSKTQPGTHLNTHRSTRNSSPVDSPITAAFAALTNNLANHNDAATVLDTLNPTDLALVRSFPTKLLDEAWNFDNDTTVRQYLPKGYKSGSDNSKQTAVENYFTIMSLLHPEHADDFWAYKRQLQSDGLNQDIICDVVDNTRKASARLVHPFAALHLQSLQRATLKELARSGKNKKNNNSSSNIHGNNNSSNNYNNNGSSNSNRNGGNGAAGSNSNSADNGRQRKFTPEQAAIFAECQAQKACYKWNTEQSCDKGEEHAVGGFSNNQTVIKHHCGRCAGRHKITACPKSRPTESAQ